MSMHAEHIYKTCTHYIRQINALYNYKSYNIVKFQLTAIVTKDTLLLGAPVPDHYSAVLGPSDNVTVLTDIAL